MDTTTTTTVILVATAAADGCYMIPSAILYSAFYSFALTQFGMRNALAAYDTFSCWMHITIETTKAYAHTQRLERAFETRVWFLFIFYLILLHISYSSSFLFSFRYASCYYSSNEPLRCYHYSPYYVSLTCLYICVCVRIFAEVPWINTHTAIILTFLEIILHCENQKHQNRIRLGFSFSHHTYTTHSCTGTYTYYHILYMPSTNLINMHLIYVGIFCSLRIDFR